MSFENLPSDKNLSVILPNNVPFSVSHYKGKLFITLPRRAPGIPSTLNYIEDNWSVGSSPSLRPYPNFELNELHPDLKPDTNRIISVYRTRVDDCGRLWFVDTGVLEENGTNPIQRPSLWIIDLNTDTVIRRFEIPTNIVEIGRGIISLRVDVDPKKCDKAYAYLCDYTAQKIYIYSYQKMRMWSFSHGTLQYDKKSTKYNIDGFKFEWQNGVASIALARRRADGCRKAFFHPLASNYEFEIDTSILQNETLCHTPNSAEVQVVQIGERGKKMQSNQHDFDEKTSVVFTSLISKNAIQCWNSNTRYSPETVAIIAQDDVSMKFPIDLKVDSDGMLWVLFNSLPRFIYGKLNPNEYNFRLWRGKTREIIKDTLCESKKFTNYKKAEDTPRR